MAAALLLSALALAPRCEDPQRARLGGEEPLDVAIDRAADFLGSRPLGHAELWFLQQGAARLGRGFPAWASTLEATAPPVWAERVLDGARHLEMQRFPLLLPPESIPPERAPAMTASIADTTAEIGALFFQVEDCSHADAASRQALRQLLGEERHGYLLAHQAWSLAVGVTRGCLPVEEAENLRRPMGLHMLSEFVWRQRLTDLDFELMAVLCVLDLCHWLPKDFVDRAIERQLPSGSWGVIPPPGVHPASVTEEHSAALAFYALASLRALGDLPRDTPLGLRCTRSGHPAEGPAPGGSGDG